MVKDVDKFLDSFISVVIASIPIFLFAVSFWAKGFDTVIDGDVVTYYITPNGLLAFSMQILLSVLSLLLAFWARISDEIESKETKLNFSIVLYLISIVIFLFWLTSLFSIS